MLVANEIGLRLYLKSERQRLQKFSKSSVFCVYVIKLFMSDMVHIYLKNVRSFII